VSRRPDDLPKRRPFPKAVKAEVLKRSGGMCEAEGCTRTGRDFDHIKPVAFGGTSTLDNCQLLCRDCNAEKGIQEGRDAAQADRKGGRSGQYARRTRAKAEGRYRPIPSPNVSGLSKHSAGYRKPEWRK
jgi:5-methylcytosine-specific restriction endonuclease McrA